MHELIEATTTRSNPGIDPSLHIWGWEIVVYLFLGGLVAGIFVLSAALELRSGEKPKGSALRLMPLAALGLLSLGMLALWLDLAHRLWAWRFYMFFHATSPMSWGAWILVLIYPVGLLHGLGSLDEAQRAWLRGKTPGALAGILERAFAWADSGRRGLLLTSVGMGISLGIYTGLLLGTMPSRIAWNSAVLGPLFLASGLSTGAALLLLLPLDEAERKFADDPTAPEARDLAYIAQRKALLAEANARATIASTQRAQAEQALAEIHARAKLEEPPARATDASERKARVAAPSQDSRE